MEQIKIDPEPSVGALFLNKWGFHSDRLKEHVLVLPCDIGVGAIVEGAKYNS